MHCTLLISDLLPPREFGEPDAKFRVASLAAMLARGDTVKRAPLTREAWLCDQFGVPAQHDRPLAAIMLKADGGEPGPYYWLYADPIQLRVDRNRLIIAGRAGDFTAAETRDLIAALNKHFTADGIEFCAPASSHWYLRTQHIPRLVTTPLAQALNRSVKHHLPHGDDALAWHRVMNEAQMILHTHPVNAAREARDAAVANSLWLWGGGTLPAIPPSRLTSTWGGGQVTQALAAAAGIAHADLPATGTAWLDRAAAGHHLVVIDALADALRAGDATAWRAQLTSLDAQWIRPLLTALRAKKINGLAMVACNHENLLATNITRADLWRCWRRARPLATYAGSA
jgi:hypothetical protein